MRDRYHRTEHHGAPVQYDLESFRGPRRFNGAITFLIGVWVGAFGSLATATLVGWLWP
jgi:hypothetical protein